jgi:hypothetical protein
VSELSDAVEAVLRAASMRLQGSDFEAVARTPEQVTTLLAVGEDVIAYETLCENLYEDDIVVARGLLSSLRAAAHRAGADVALIEILLI